MLHVVSIGDYSDSYDSSEEEEEDESSPKEKILTTSRGFQDFRVKSLKAAHVGRKVISIAEQGQLFFNHDHCVSSEDLKWSADNYRDARSEDSPSQDMCVHWGEAPEWC